MSNNIRKIMIALTLLVGNSVFMIVVGPMRLYDSTVNALSSGYSFLGDFMLKIAEGRFVILTFAIILVYICKLFKEETPKK